MINIYEHNGNESITPKSLTESYFKRAKKMVTWVGSLKTLLTAHKLTHLLGERFIMHYTAHKLPDLSKFNSKAKDDDRKCLLLRHALTVCCT